MKGKGGGLHQLAIVVTITGTVLAAGVGRAAGPADTNWLSYNGTSTASAIRRSSK
jgi:hypothetical protein